MGPWKKTGVEERLKKGDSKLASWLLISLILENESLLPRHGPSTDTF
jgi:hypothetical protein